MKVTWHKVTESLPATLQDVWVYGGYEVYLTRYDGDFHPAITHWAEYKIPEPPSTEPEAPARPREYFKFATPSELRQAQRFGKAINQPGIDAYWYNGILYIWNINIKPEK